MKFTAISLMLSLFFFVLTGESQDPITLRIVLSVISASATTALYCGLTQDMGASTAIMVPLAVIVGVATMTDPDPSILQLLLALIAAPIIAAIAIKQELDNETLVESDKTPSDQRSKPTLHL